MSKPGILFLRSSSEIPAGSDKQIVNLAYELFKDGRTLPILFSDNNCYITSEFKKIGCPVYIDPNFNKLRHFFKTKQIITKIINKHKIRLMQAHGFRDDMIIRCFKVFYPNMIHFYRPHAHIENSTISKLRMLSYHLLDFLTQFFTDRYVCIANCIKSELIHKSRIKNNKITVIRDGVEGFNQECEPLPEKGTILEKKIAILARVVPKKGHDTLFKSVSLLKKQNTVVNVRVIGTGPQVFLTELLDLAKSLNIFDNIEFYGFSNNIFDALRGIPVVVHPSETEVLPNSIIEAWSAQKIVIASSVGGIPEMVEHNKNGLLHNVGDHTELARLLKMVFESEGQIWNSMRLAGQFSYVSQYSCESYRHNFLDLYRSFSILN